MSTTPVTPALPQPSSRPDPVGFPGPARPTQTVSADPAAAGASVALMLGRIGVLASAASCCYAAYRAVGSPASLPQTQVWMNLAIIAVDLVCLGMLAAALPQQGSSLRRLLSTATPRRDLLLGLALFPVLAVAWLAASCAGTLVAFQGPPPAMAPVHVPLVVALSSLLVMPATVAITEEALFRATALPALRPYLGRVGATVASALLFGAQHVVFAVGSTPQMAARFVTTFLVGLVLGGLWFRTGRVWPLIVAHWLLDVAFIGLPMMALATGVLR